jgi:hypothetical protein
LLLEKRALLQQPDPQAAAPKEKAAPPAAVGGNPFAGFLLIAKSSISPESLYG